MEDTNTHTLKTRQMPVQAQGNQRLVIWIANLKSLCDIYGRQVRYLAFDAVSRYLHSKISGARIDFFKHSDDVVLSSMQFLTTGPSRAEFLSAIQTELALLPIIQNGNALCLNTQVAFLKHYQPDREGMVSEEVSLSAGVTHFYQRSNDGLFKTDMQLAACLFSALREKQLQLSFQPVTFLQGTRISNPDTGGVLYHEALLRVTEGSPLDYRLPKAIEALERLGLAGHLDYCVIRAVISSLETHQDIKLGCNVSASTLQPSLYWEALFDYLSHHRAIAERLVIEVSETYPAGNYRLAVGILKRLQELGVQIAMDDIGSGFSPLGLLVEVRPEITKIDRSILLLSRNKHYTPDLLKNLIKVCAEFSRSVVVEGIESKLELSAAQYGGASAVQGNFIAPPSLTPDWLRGLSCVVGGNLSFLVVSNDMK